ncbi:MAG: nucleotide pyrophosphohydrolase [bacterium]
MPIKELQQQLEQFATQRDWQQFHSPRNLAAALSVEASELLEHFLWQNDSQASNPPDAIKKHEISLEMADVFAYLLRMASQLDIDLEQALREKMAINEKRFPVELVKGIAGYKAKK